MKWTIDQLAQFIYIFKVHAADISQVEELPEGEIPDSCCIPMLRNEKVKAHSRHLDFTMFLGKARDMSGDDYLHSSDLEISRGQILQGNMTVECLHDGDVLTQVHPYVQHHSNVMNKVFEIAKSNLDSCDIKPQKTDGHDDEFNHCRKSERSDKRVEAKGSRW